MSDDSELQRAIWPPRKMERPAKTRKATPRTDLEALRKWLQENEPGDYCIGEFKSAQRPKGAWAEYGIEVEHVEFPDRPGVFGRFVRLATSADASVTPLRSADNG